MIMIEGLSNWRLLLIIQIGGKPFGKWVQEYVRRGARIKELEESIKNCHQEIAEQTKKLLDFTEMTKLLREKLEFQANHIRHLEATASVPFTTRLTKERL